MKETCPVSVTVFDGHTFERHAVKENTSGLSHCRYTVDGIEFSKEQWEQQQQLAMARDMTNLGIKQ